MDYIFIEKSKDDIKVGYVKDENLTEFYLEKERTKSLIGNVYRGRVLDIIEGMNSAFIDIGEEKNAYLSFSDSIPIGEIYNRRTGKISDFLKQGSDILVQVTRDSYDDKGAKVTRHIELPGKHIIFNPKSNRINVSRKIKNKAKRNRLEELGKKIIIDDYGMIIRTAAEEVEEWIIEEEYNTLYNIYEKLKRELNFIPCPKLIYRDLKDWEEIIRDRKLDYIIVNDKKIYENILEIEDQYGLEIKDKIRFNKEFSLDYDFNLSKQLKRGLSREVYLKSGASIVIDEVEALTVIDVNTKSYIGKSNLEKTILETNIEAAKEISKQIRLRNIGGIIIIDFIRMDKEKDIKKLMNEFKEQIEKDPMQTDIAGMTKLGLLELTRKKTRPTLGEIFDKS